ncbi:PREDICTED: uncharacterized protein LOC106320769 [Brassica oleracea var. oleracea]|uniref:uncharacterized protein LOC106320769 n=1 Tax=Brassica oleracea var. oleracea TaxID=109376 RepID=UPI0006A7083C|nr:PREDICTED: uncharacterized protein LOC106320769 [Brassica oleracea var. oleracea]
MIGDFNEITDHSEKEGGRKCADSSCLPFKQMLSDCGVLEFPFTGNKLSWVGKRSGGTTVRCRLDRAVGNEDWHEKFPHSTVKYLRLWGSDHRPVLADILTKPVRRKKNFKFDKRWLDNEELSFRKALSQWRRQNNVNSEKLVEELKEKVEGLYANDDAISEEISEALKELSTAPKAEELFWRQKSRVLWLRKGDTNSKYFHALVKQRRARNRITQLLDENGNVVEDEEELVAIATSYFRQIFESSIPEDIADALAEVSTTITGDVNEKLTAPVTEWEVKLASFAMHPENALRPDGMTTLFYQKFWDIVKEDLTRMVNQFLFERTMAQGLNDTIPANDRQQIKDTLGIQNEGEMGSYLGIPEDISGSKCKLFAFLKEQLLHRVNGWTGRWLSKGGKEVLIKSILLALPTYVMFSFLLPLEICENLASAITQFWWSLNPPKRGIHWAKWEKIFISGESSLGKYYRLSSPLRTGAVDTPSYIWTSIIVARKLQLLGIRSKVHSGYEINVWEDPWIPSTPARPARARVPVVNPKMTVNSLIDFESKDWDVRLLEQYVDQEDILMIQSMAISPTHRRILFVVAAPKMANIRLSLDIGLL